ncbi:hypothetical protein P8452_75656 [Trifolium repens]|nr:hypothetical protein P8452_75656 [Trifolium repens]
MVSLQNLSFSLPCFLSSLLCCSPKKPYSFPPPFYFKVIVSSLRRLFYFEVVGKPVLESYRISPKTKTKPDVWSLVNFVSKPTSINPKGLLSLYCTPLRLLDDPVFRKLFPPTRWATEFNAALTTPFFHWLVVPFEHYICMSIFESLRLVLVAMVKWLFIKVVLMESIMQLVLRWLENEVNVIRQV